MSHRPIRTPLRRLPTPLLAAALVAAGGLLWSPTPVVAQATGPGVTSTTARVEPPLDGKRAVREPVSALKLAATPELDALRERIEAARLRDPVAFEHLASTRVQVAAMDRGRRGRWAATSPIFRALGARALLPMLDALLADEALVGGRDPSMARRAWRVGMLQAIAELRDATARPLLLAILDSAEPDPVVMRTAAEALGALGSDADVAALRARIGRSGSAGAAAIAGLGYARGKDAARILGEALEAELDTVLEAESEPGRVEALVEALGRVGNAFAWRLAHLRARADAAQTRDLAAAALLEAYTALEGAGRDAARRAFLVVDAPSSAHLLAQARARHPRKSAALDALAQRMARHPLRSAPAPSAGSPR